METSTHFKIACIHESIWNTDTVSFNSDRKYLYFDPNDYKIGERLCIWELTFLKSRSSWIIYHWYAFNTLWPLLILCYFVMMLYRRYTAKYFEFLHLKKIKKKSKNKCKFKKSICEGMRKKIRQNPCVFLNSPIQLESSQVQLESSLYVFNLTAH